MPHKSNRHSFRVIFGDTDAMGVVYYANYLRYFEAGRAELMRALGVPYRELEQLGLSLPVTKAEVEYHAPSRYEDELELETTLEEVRRASFRIKYLLVRKVDQQLIASGATTHACLGPKGVTRLPDVLRRSWSET